MAEASIANLFLLFRYYLFLRSFIQLLLLKARKALPHYVLILRPADFERGLPIDVALPIRTLRAST